MAAVGAERLVFRSPEGAERGLLETKLARPRVPPTYVARPRINQLLEAGTGGPLTVVSAGAGWGKTLATAAWAGSEPAAGPVAWVSLDDSENESRAFWSYVVAAVRRAIAVPPGSPLARLVPGLGSDDENIRRLMAGLAGLPMSVVVVLDDFQIIHDPAVLSGVADLLRHPIPQLRLVLSTRADPELPLHRLRLTGDLAEVRSRDLAFTVAEARSLLSANGVSVDANAAELLVQRTEGWPAGLRLAALFLDRQESDRGPADFAGDDQVVTEYLAEEVLASQPPEAQRFLVRTSVAERLTAGLANVLTGQPRSQHYLEALADSNAFVVGLGPGREWFRYHALLREMLQHRLAVEEPDLLSDLHRRAAQWFAENGFPIEAMRHAADAADWLLVGRLFVTHAVPLLVSVDRTALDHVLARIPSQRLTDSPELALCAAGRLMHAGRFADMQPHLELARAELDASNSSPRTRVALLLLSTAVSRTRGDITALVDAAHQAVFELSRPALSLPAAGEYRAIALGNLGAGLLWSGQLGEAEMRLLDALAAAKGSRLDAARINILAHLGMVATASGRLRTGFGYATQAVELVEARGWAPLPQAATAYLALALINLQWNNTTEAQTLLAQGRAASVAEPASRCALDLAQARMDASLGRVGAARDRIARLRYELAAWEPPTFLARWLAITEAEIDLAAGDPAAAITRIGPPADQGPPFAREQVCLARAFLEGGEPEHAEEVLAPLLSATAEPSAVVEVWLLTALAADRRREDNRASQALHRALALAESEGVRRPFVALAHQRLPHLLAQLQRLEPGGSVDFADELLADVSPEVSHGAPSDVLVDPLTDRELSVLRFLPTMMTNAEIATELYVSVNTVKAHLKRIFLKLDVTSRRQAVHRGRELRLLTD